MVNKKVKDRRLKKTLDDARTMALNAARAEMLLVEEPGYITIRAIPFNFQFFGS